MNAKQFLSQLNKLYVRGRNGILCKLFFNSITFSYDLHDETRKCFSKDNLLYCSEVFYWNMSDIKDYKIILNDIHKNIKKQYRAKHNI